MILTHDIALIEIFLSSYAKGMMNDVDGKVMNMYCCCFDYSTGSMVQ